MADVRPIIRTSDRIQFKKCRRAWDIGSKIRQNLEPVASRPALDFGTAWHVFGEVYYNPETWSWDKEVVRELARTAMHAKLKKQLDFYEKHVADPTELREQFKDFADMGNGMIDYFTKWAQTNETLTPMYVEIEFEIPIIWSFPIPEWFASLGFSTTADNDQLTYNGVRVFYQGRIDMIARDQEGRYWVVDHKTAARLQDTTEFLELDEQMKSYVWAARHVLGIDVIGVCYSEHYKGWPEYPKVLDRPRKGLILSTNKQQDTDLATFLQAIKDQGEDPSMYEEYISFLEAEGRTFVRRMFIQYSRIELENLGKQVALEAVDMLGDPFIYPSPDKFSCKWCDHRLMCMALNDGSDTVYIRDTHYRDRSNAE